MSGAEPSEALETYVGHLRYAIATTNCPETLDMLRTMLADARRRLDGNERLRSPSLRRL